MASAPASVDVGSQIDHSKIASIAANDPIGGIRRWVAWLTDWSDADPDSKGAVLRGVWLALIAVVQIVRSPRAN